jgi:signal transduction histidine kinase
MTLANQTTTPPERRSNGVTSPPPSGNGLARTRYSLTRSMPDLVWTWMRDLPVVRDWRIASDALFLLTSFGLGLFWFITIVVLGAIGISTLIVWIGVPILAALFALVIWGAQFERSRVRIFLDVEIPTPYRYIPAEGKPWKRAWGLLGNRQLWRDFSYLLALFPMGILGLFVVWLPVPFLYSPLVTIGGGSTEALWWDINHFFESLVAFIFGVILILPTAALINMTARLNGVVAQKLLAPSVEDVLIERVEELTESRSAVMRAMHLERRRIERDLHDGAQQRLVSLAMELGLAREKMESDPEGARKLLEASHEDAKLVLAELRDLVRGIHPAVLTDRGLDAAISAIAGRSPIPITVNVDLKRRLPEEVEGTAYFVVVEALTNVAKHSGATAARVSIRLQRGWLMLEISDNGRGGADPAAGSGLRGLRDRILALDGTFRIDSPAGKGTTVAVAIPAG